MYFVERSFTLSLLTAVVYSNKPFTHQTRFRDRSLITGSGGGGGGYYTKQHRGGHQRPSIRPNSVNTAQEAWL